MCNPPALLCDGKGVITRSVDFESLYAAERPALIRLAHLLTGSTAIAEELAQEALFVTQQDGLNWRIRPGTRGAPW